ncbi:TIM barrel protein [Candidatus Beckwithbacteria bacterium]|nr:TIM barrel protein [Candidatus Beckwithbacteria bacterium]
MHQIGLKLWSTNDFYVEEAQKLFSKKVYNYIELYTVPDSYAKFYRIWRNLNIPYIIHAPHFTHGVNLASKINFKKNIELIEEAQRFADTLKAKYIIVHPGCNGDIKETARQLGQIDDSRILVENMPYLGIEDGIICNGSTYNELQYVLSHTNKGFCLDIHHAFSSSAYHKIDPISFVKKLLTLRPSMFHLADSKTTYVRDKHLNIGKGNLPIKDIIKLIPNNSFISLETKKQTIQNLNVFIEDVSIIKELENYDQNK